MLEDISNSLTNYLDAKRVKDFRIIIISYLSSVLPDFILQLSRFTSTKFRFQLSSSCFKFIKHRVYNNFVSRMQTYSFRQSKKINEIKAKSNGKQTSRGLKRYKAYPGIFDWVGYNFVSENTESCLNWSSNNLTRILRNSVVEIILVKKIQ